MKALSVISKNALTTSNMEIKLLIWRTIYLYYVHMVRQRVAQGLPNERNAPACQRCLFSSPGENQHRYKSSRARNGLRVARNKSSRKTAEKRRSRLPLFLLRQKSPLFPDAGNI